MTTSLLDAEIEFNRKLEANTVDSCAICGVPHMLNEMSECPACGHVCTQCDCHCPVIQDAA